MGRLDCRVAIATGSTRGIGAGIVGGFAKEGAPVVVSGRGEDEGFASVTSSPSRRMWPSETRSNPAIQRSVVDFPQPDGQTSTRNSPSSIVISRSSTATIRSPPSPKTS